MMLVNFRIPCITLKFNTGVKQLRHGLKAPMSFPCNARFADKKMVN